MQLRHLLFSVALVLFAFGCVNKKQVEDSIKTKMSSSGVEMKSVTCPSGGGNTYTCTGETKDGDSLSFDVTSDGSGGIKWELQGKILDLDKLGDALEDDLPPDADVECPSKTIALIKGKKFTCPIVVKGEKDKLEVTATNNAGNVKWKIVGSGAEGEGDDKTDKKKSKKSGDDDDDDDDDKSKKKSKKSKGDDDDDNQ